VREFSRLEWKFFVKFGADESGLAKGVHIKKIFSYFAQKVLDYGTKRWYNLSKQIRWSVYE
jgi:hypothetical protein